MLKQKYAGFLQQFSSSAKGGTRCTATAFKTWQPSPVSISNQFTSAASQKVSGGNVNSARVVDKSFEPSCVSVQPFALTREPAKLSDTLNPLKELVQNVRVDSLKQTDQKLSKLAHSHSSRVDEHFSLLGKRSHHSLVHQEPARATSVSVASLVEFE
jgi:hypothetical protein